MSLHPYVRHREHDVRFGQDPTMFGRAPQAAGALALSVVMVSAAFVRIGYNAARDGVRHIVDSVSSGRNHDDGSASTMGAIEASELIEGGHGL